MHSLKSFVFQAWVDGEGPNADRCMIRWEARDDSPGLRADSFYFGRPEIEALVSGESSATVDGYTKLEVFGDCWTFVEFEMPRAESGVAQVPYRRITIPRFVVRMLLRKARQIWAAQRAVPKDDRWRCPRVEISLDDATRARLVRQYGQGTGRLDVQVDERAADMFATDNATEEFRERVAYIGRIASNTTRAFFDTATLVLQKDYDSYYWVARDPKGRCIMNGGLIRRDGEWSIHT